jgi:hypothetical protein
VHRKCFLACEIADICTLNTAAFSEMRGRTYLAVNLNRGINR